MKKNIKPLDYLFIFIFLLCVIGSFFWAFQGKSVSPKLLVETPHEKWIYDLQLDGFYEFSGIIGKTGVVIENGEARVIDSCCPNKTCLASTPISKVGEWIACLPNKIILRIEGNINEKKDFDIISR